MAFRFLVLSEVKLYALGKAMSPVFVNCILISGPAPAGKFVAQTQRWKFWKPDQKGNSGLKRTFHCLPLVIWIWNQSSSWKRQKSSQASNVLTVQLCQMYQMLNRSEMSKLSKLYFCLNFPNSLKCPICVSHVSKIPYICDKCLTKEMPLIKLGLIALALGSLPVFL